MRSDLYSVAFDDLDALAVYTYRAAGVVGRWLTELHGIRDQWMLDRATELGQAMQLTNILRDVGEDLGRGRMYLPAAELDCVGLTRGDIDAIARGRRPIDAAYRELMERLMDVADAGYDRASEAIRYLPPEFGWAAAIASAVYRGIHQAIRRNGYDNVRRRAYTTASRKVALAASAVVGLARARILRAVRV
jgi:phytoene synthase